MQRQISREAGTKHAVVERDVACSVEEFSNRPTVLKVPPVLFHSMVDIPS
jgi:hypothetical protein